MYGAQPMHSPGSRSNKSSVRPDGAHQTLCASALPIGGRHADLLVITGDVFDSSTPPPGAATRAFARLHDVVIETLGGKARTVIVPGNHDRRQKGCASSTRTNDA